MKFYFVTVKRTVKVSVNSFLRKEGQTSKIIKASLGVGNKYTKRLKSNTVQLDILRLKENNDCGNNYSMGLVTEES